MGLGLGLGLRLGLGLLGVGLGVAHPARAEGGHPRGEPKVCLGGGDAPG